VPPVLLGGRQRWDGTTTFFTAAQNVCFCCRLNRSTQHLILDGKMECMQYLSKRTDLSVYSQAQPNKAARQLNEQPRETLGFEIPAERFNEVLRRPVETTTQSGH